MIRPRAFVGGSWSDNGEEDDEKAKDETCLIARASNEICLRVDLEPNEWIKDSECSKHMTGNRNLFSSYNAYNGEEAIKVIEKQNLENDIEDETLAIDEIVNIKESRNHPLENVIGNLNQRTLRSQAQDQSNFFCFISTIEPKNVNEALTDESWLIAMQEESNQFIANDVWELVAQGYNQQEGIIYDETYAHVAILESIRILLAYACALDIKLLQMDVKSAFMNDFINEECLPARFQEAPKTSHLEAVKRIFRYIKGTTHLGLWYPKGTGIETRVYDDSYHTGDYVDRKSNIGICMFVGCCLTSWFSKKQTALAISTTEAEYVMSINHGELDDYYDLHDRVMYPLTAQQEQKTRKDYGTKRGRYSTSSSFAFGQPSSSHLNDDDDDGNDERTSRASTLSPTRFVNSLTNEVP
ncbi:retrovirus-related pol polyprotein from transposon TNT 1-94 [Tanacetum coccineum]|uniref:Retrovirus-related pol polyprotein from transposon TNT 1-94 n=1 Tax=Tanacetum coccineum TaxID=301880 RepID=A0ABQ4WMJ5_9ASTR